MAVNARGLETSPEPGEFVSSSGLKDLLVNTVDSQNVNGSLPRFREYYCETQAANDLFPSESNNNGRPNFYLENAMQAYRDATITYSDVSNPGGSKMAYGSFNPSLANFKDLREDYGPIQAIENMGDNLFVIQSDRCTTVPVNRNVIQSADGDLSLTTSTNVLGASYIYETDAGCDFNPESVTVVNDTIYFANKSVGKVFRYVKGGGIEEISDRKVSAFFRDTFRKAIEGSVEYNAEDVRVVGGYDPKNDEYILTIIDPGQEYVPDVSEVVGCTDTAAANYDPTATIDFGCFYEEIAGCTDPLADNYDMFATVDDGSCEFAPDPEVDVEYSKLLVEIPGCTSERFIELNINVEYDPETNDTVILGTESTFKVDGVQQGTLDTRQFFTDYIQTSKTDPELDLPPDGSFRIEMTLPLTQIDNDSGLRVWNELSKLGSSNGTVNVAGNLASQTFYTLQTFGQNNYPGLNSDGTAGEIDWYIYAPCSGDLDYTVSNATEPVFSPNTFTQYVTFAPDGSPLTNTVETSLNISVIDELEEATLGLQPLIDDASVVTCQIPITINVYATTLAVPGCNDPTACNFNPVATEDDGSCIPLHEYCKGPDGGGPACNEFIPWVNGQQIVSTTGVFPDDWEFDPGSPCATPNNDLCDVSCLGCTDPNAGNYDIDATIDDGSCIYLACQIPYTVMCEMDAYGSGMPGQLTTGDIVDWIVDNMSEGITGFDVDSGDQFLIGWISTFWDGWTESCLTTLTDVYNTIADDCGTQNVYTTSSGGTV